MATKLTLNLDKKVIEQAKQYASQRGSSLSELVENYFKLLTESPPGESEYPLSPMTNKLKGALKVDDDFDYKKILEEEKMKKYHG